MPARWLLLLLATCPLPAQSEPPAKVDEPPKVTADSPLGEPAALPDGAPEAMARIDRDGLRRHVFWLADDQRRGRYTGSPQQQETARYIAARLQQLGCEPLGDKKGYLQNYPLEAVSLDAAATSLAFGQDKITTGYAVLPTGDDDKVAVSGRLLYCGSGRPDEVPNGIKGKIPVVVVGKPPRGAGGNRIADPTALRRSADIAREFGNEGAAAGVICLLDGGGAFSNALNYGALLPGQPRLCFQGQDRNPAGGRVPVLFLAEAQSRQLLAAMGVQFDADGNPDRLDPDVKLQAKLQVAVRRDARAGASNVVALLPGKERRKEAVLFSAHMDHIGTRIDGDAFNGADDNASGIAALLEIAEAFAGGGRPGRSLLFLAVSGEELGLFGSTWFTANPTFPLDQVVAALNLDMVGRAGGKDGRIDLLLTPSFRHAEYNSLARTCAGFARRFGIELAAGDQYFSRSDQVNFAQQGIPVAFLCDGEPPQYHQVDDSANTLHYAHLEAIARLCFWTGWQIAHDKERPKRLGPQAGW